MSGWGLAVLHQLPCRLKATLTTAKASGRDLGPCFSPDGLGAGMNMNAPAAANAWDALSGLVGEIKRCE